MLAVFLAGAVTTLVAKALLPRSEEKALPPAPDIGKVDFDDLTEKIESLSDLKDQLYEIENMITEIESSEQGERGVAIKLTMPAADTNYNFLVNNQSDAVLNLLYTERCRLRSSIVSELSKIQIRSTQNVRKTMMKTTSRGEVCNG